MENKGGQRLTLLRTALNWSQPEFAQKADVSVMSISRIENSKQKDIESYRRTLNKIAERFGVNLNWLMEGKGSMWLTGTDEENVARIKAGGKNSSGESESFVEIKKELDRYREREDRLQRIIDRLLNGGTNFRKALGNASYRTPAKSVA